jgi:hypothetical protein
VKGAPSKLCVIRKAAALARARPTLLAGLGWQGWLSYYREALFSFFSFFFFLIGAVKENARGKNLYITK